LPETPPGSVKVSPQLTIVWAFAGVLSKKTAAIKRERRRKGDVDFCTASIVRVNGKYIK